MPSIRMTNDGVMVRSSQLAGFIYASPAHIQSAVQKLQVMGYDDEANAILDMIDQHRDTEERHREGYSSLMASVDRIQQGATRRGRISMFVLGVAVALNLISVFFRMISQ